MLGPRFIPASVFYIQSVMLSPCFILESVFYTQFVVRSPQSVVRSPCFILNGEGMESILFMDRNKMALVRKSNIPGFDSLHRLFFRNIRY